MREWIHRYGTRYGTLIKVIAVVAIGVAGAVFAYTMLTQSPQTLVAKIDDAQTITMPEKQTTESTTTTRGADKYEHTATVEKPVVETQFLFTALGFEWNDARPAGTTAELYVRARSGEAWTPWYLVPRDIDNKTEEEDNRQEKGRQSGFLPFNPSDAYQLKIVLTSVGTATPSIGDVRVTAIHAPAVSSAETPTSLITTVSAHELTAPTRATAPIGALTAEITTDQIPKGHPTIISRSQWGADESIRIYKGDSPEPPQVKLSGDYLEKFSDELQIVNKVATNDNGQLYTWPQEYPKTISKFIIHHTASTANLNNPKQAIRDIYYWHAVGRGWGDIGYNYLVDPQGNIYEGRAGGEGVIGAHAGKSNTGAIGIAVMGNYEAQDAPEQAMISLSHLIADKAALHHIDPTGTSMFRGTVSNNVLGHRDVMSTSCPGQTLYDKLPFIARLAKAERSTTVEGPFFKKQQKLGYDFADRTNVIYASIDPDQAKTITIQLQNTGNKPWNANTSIVVSDYDTMTRSLIVKTPPNKHAIPMDQPRTIGTGDTATFTLPLTGGLISKLLTLKIAPLIDGKTRLEKVVELPVNVTPTVATYEVVKTTFPGKALKAGERFAASVELRNTGNFIWRKTGPTAIKLGTDRPRDHESHLTPTHTSRIGTLEQNEVKPGEIGRFIIPLRAPRTTELVDEYMTPVIDGFMWLKNANLGFTTLVYQKELLASPLQGPNAVRAITANANETVTTSIYLRNFGGTTWDSATAIVPVLKKVGASRLTLISSSMKPSRVEPGETATFDVTLKTPKSFTQQKIALKPYIGKQAIMSNEINVKVTRPPKVPKPPAQTPVQPSSSAASRGANVRVLIGFTGTPVITGNGPFSLQAGDLKLAFNKSETITVEVKNDLYTIYTPSGIQTATSPVRFMPETGTILRIDNFERSPEWNLAINDNEFRGILEVRQDGVINELPIEDYVKGIAEVPNSEPAEKTKAIIIAARTYALYYTSIGKKFPGKPYDLDDNPEHTQKYRGYGYEKRSPNTVRAVNETAGLAITYNNIVALAPYFSVSNGKTLSANAAWGWTNTPYLVSVDDPYCKGMKQQGHGVGMSGCGALGMANAGKTYDQILSYYYRGITLKKLY